VCSSDLLNWLESNLDDRVLIVSVMHANNEFGTLNDVRSASDLAHRHGVLVHSDAVQTFLAPGLSWKLTDLDADLVTVSAHKINGPKGTGAIYTRAGVKVKPLVVGGGQEREVRGGTENVAGIVGFGTAIRLRAESVAAEANPRDTLRERVLALGAVPSVSDGTPTLRGHLHVRFPGIDAETLLIVLDRLGVAASSGAACSSGSIEPSHVMVATGYSVEQAKQGIRFSLGANTTLADVELASERIAEALCQIEGAKQKSR
jgi:cysteine desulfurase